ncbi:MAG: hypothetical protein QXW98_04170 [Candidatus Caldarchaeum sp.]
MGRKRKPSTYPIFNLNNVSETGSNDNSTFFLRFVFIDFIKPLVAISQYFTGTIWPFGETPQQVSPVIEVGGGEIKSDAFNLQNGETNTQELPKLSDKDVKPEKMIQ